jgi:hypothetical protein
VDERLMCLDLNLLQWNLVNRFCVRTLARTMKPEQVRMCHLEQIHCINI